MCFDNLPRPSAIHFCVGDQFLQLLEREIRQLQMESGILRALLGDILNEEEQRKAHERTRKRFA